MELIVILIIRDNIVEQFFVVHELKAVIQLKIGPKKGNTVPTGFYRIVGYNNQTTSGLVNVNYLI